MTNNKMFNQHISSKNLQPRNDYINCVPHCIGFWCFTGEMAGEVGVSLVFVGLIEAGSASDFLEEMKFS
jgi:hypothetical protein